MVPDATPERLAELSRAGMRSYLRYWMESFRLPAWSKERIKDGFDAEGRRTTSPTGSPPARASILALPHLGNWDLAGAWVTTKLETPFTTVAERLKPESLYDRFVAYREGLGMEVLPHSGGTAFGTLARRLRDGGLVCLVAERDLSASGVEVKFFGETTRMPAGPALLAQQTGALLLPVTLWYDDSPVMRGRVHPPVEVPETGTPGREDVCHDTGAGRRLRHGDRRPPGGLAHAAALVARDLDPGGIPRGPDQGPGSEKGTAVRIGIVCPYSWDVPGGVQFHIRDLAEHLIRLGHEVSVLAPADDETPLPPYVVSAGRAVPVPYNGSVARLNFGFLSAARVRRWLHDGTFDVIHIHEPASPSLGLLACWAAQGPIVATFHTSNPRSRAMIAAYPILQPALEKISARIAVSEYARRTLVEHLGGDAVVIPNGVDVDFFARAEPKPEWQGETIGFIGRIDEPRKGLPVLMKALPKILAERPRTRLLVAGRGDEEEAVEDLPEELRSRVEFLGMVSDEDKARFLRSVDVYVAPNTGGESFGIILVEALSAGAPVLASDLDAFAQVLDQGAAGELFANEDADALAASAVRLLGDPARRAELRERGSAHVRRFDWSTVGADILSVYETVTDGAAAVAADERTGLRARFGLARD